MGLGALTLVGSMPPVEATGTAVCTISGTITFSHSELTSTGGRWTVGPAVISCHGLYNGYERIMGPGRFAGAGTYTAFPSGTGTCLHSVGSGTVEYGFPTTAYDIRLVEPQNYTLAGAGAFTTPSLKGTFEVTPPYDGDCVTKPITSALFVAQASLVRFYPGGGGRPDPPPNRDQYKPEKSRSF
jgi:hypothetical protein